MEWTRKWDEILKEYIIKIQSGSWRVLWYKLVVNRIEVVLWRLMKFVGVNALLLGDAPAGMKRVFNRLLIKSGFDIKLFCEDLWSLSGEMPSYCFSRTNQRHQVYFICIFPPLKGGTITNTGPGRYFASVRSWLYP